VPHGGGAVLWLNGNKFSSQFKAGVPYSEGVYTWADGSQARFQMNEWVKISGEVKYQYKLIDLENPNHFENATLLFRSGRLVGTYTFANGDIYQGDFLQGNIHNGELTTSNELEKFMIRDGNISILETGDLYRDGETVLKDYIKALSYYQDVAIGLHPNRKAMERIAKLYMENRIEAEEDFISMIRRHWNGTSERQNQLVEAYIWSNLAGSPLRDKLEKELGAEQLRKAQEISIVRKKELASRSLHGNKYPSPTLSEVTKRHLQTMRIGFSGTDSFGFSDGVDED
jgi:hypothetical protein